MKISASVFELVVFILSLAGLLALQITGHSNASLNEVLTALLGGAAGHGVGRIMATPIDGEGPNNAGK